MASSMYTYLNLLISAGIKDDGESKPSQSGNNPQCTVRGMGGSSSAVPNVALELS